MMKPGGTGSPARVISASPAPLPPEQIFLVAGAFLKEIDRLRRADGGGPSGRGENVGQAMVSVREVERARVSRVIPRTRLR